MKKTFFIFLLIFINSVSFSQNGADIGILGGAFWYIGDVNQMNPFYSPNPAYGIVYKHNVDTRLVGRFSVINGNISGNDLDFDNVYQQNRQYSFQTNITDINLEVEFNFLPYNIPDKKQEISPYITGGISLIVAPNTNASPFIFGIPMGVGIKARLNKNLSIGFEWAYRKAFTDYLDQLTQNEIDPNQTEYYNKQRAFVRNDDWYSFTGFYIMYNIRGGKDKCPAYQFGYN